MYEASAHVYDEIYAGKDYAGEAARVHALVQARSPGARTLLDVACGTGRHLAELRDRYEVEGVDLSPGLLAVARERLPEVRLHEADMRDFDLGRAFDVVTCLFSAIGHMPSREDLRRAVDAMARHLAPGGVLVLEPWVTPDRWREGVAGAAAGERVARAYRSWRQGEVAHLEYHYAVARPDGIVAWDEHHELVLFSDEDYEQAIRTAGLEPEHDPEGLTGRGLWIGVRPR